MDLWSTSAPSAVRIIYPAWLCSGHVMTSECRYVVADVRVYRAPVAVHVTILLKFALLYCKAATEKVVHSRLARLAGAIVKELDLWVLMRKRLRLIGSTMRSRSAAFKAALVAKFAEEFRIELRRGELRPVVDKARHSAASSMACAPWLHRSWGGTAWLQFFSC